MIGRILLTILILSVCPATAAAGPQCKEGSPLLALVNQSEIVAVVGRRGRVDFGPTGTRSSIRISAEFREFFKPPVIGGIDLGGPQTIYLEGGDVPSLMGKKHYLVFLTYLKRNTWLANRCEYLPISDKGMVANACTAISDLFGDRPYERERLCLLNYPPSASLPAVRREIAKAVQDNRQIGETAKFSRNGRWIPDADHQMIVFELPTRARSEFFGSKRRVDSFPIKAYIKTDTLSKRKFERHVRRGVRFSFTGFWQKGSFIIQSIDWMSGRRPR